MNFDQKFYCFPEFIYGFYHLFSHFSLFIYDLVIFFIQEGRMIMVLGVFLTFYWIWKKSYKNYTIFDFLNFFRFFCEFFDNFVFFSIFFLNFVMFLDFLSKVFHKNFQVLWEKKKCIRFLLFYMLILPFFRFFFNVSMI